MKKRKLTRRGSALRWLAALLVVSVFVCVTDIYCITQKQAINKMAQRYDLGELQLLETVKEDTLPYGADRAYILQNQDLTGFSCGARSWRSGWGCTRPQVMEHGSQPTVPVDFVYFRGEEEGFIEYGKGNFRAKPYVFAIILDPNVETVEISLGRNVESNKTLVWEERDRIRLARADWSSGPYCDYIFCSFDPCKLGFWPEIRALDMDGNPITWTDVDGNQVEWYGSGWSDEYYDDYINHLNGQRH